MNHNKNMIFKRKIVKEAGLFVKRFDLCSNVRRFVGFVAYGLSIFFYIKAQGIIGASKTNAYYSIAPFIGTLLSVIILEKKLTWSYFLGLTIMIGGTIIVVIDTLEKKHCHLHEHKFTHTHNGNTHTHIIKHEHNHYFKQEIHTHKHKNSSVH